MKSLLRWWTELVWSRFNFIVDLTSFIYSKLEVFSWKILSGRISVIMEINNYLIMSLWIYPIMSLWNYLIICKYPIMSLRNYLIMSLWNYLITSLWNSLAASRKYYNFLVIIDISKALWQEAVIRQVSQNLNDSLRNRSWFLYVANHIGFV